VIGPVSDTGCDQSFSCKLGVAYFTFSFLSCISDYEKTFGGTELEDGVK